jgi:hypothetical protein
MFTTRFYIVLGVVVHDCNHSTWEAEVGLRVQGQPGLHSETLSQKMKTQTKKRTTQRRF